MRPVQKQGPGLLLKGGEPPLMLNSLWFLTYQPLCLHLGGSLCLECFSSPGLPGKLVAPQHSEQSLLPQLAHSSQSYRGLLDSPGLCTDHTVWWTTGVLGSLSSA